MDYAIDRGINFFDTAELYAMQEKHMAKQKKLLVIGLSKEKIEIRLS